MPSLLSASPNLEVLKPMPIPNLSSARYSTYTFPSFTTAPGLKVSFSSHRSKESLIGSIKVEFESGRIMGLTEFGLSNPPKVQTISFVVATSGLVETQLTKRNNKAIENNLLDMFFRLIWLIYQMDKPL